MIECCLLKIQERCQRPENLFKQLLISYISEIDLVRKTKAFSQIEKVRIILGRKTVQIRKVKKEMSHMRYSAFLIYFT